MLVAVALAIGTATAVSPVAGQADSRNGNSEVQHRNSCRLAHQVLVQGQPANKREWALGYITGCGAIGGEALAALLPRYRAVDGPGGGLEKVVESAALMADGRIFGAALSLAGDPDAGDGARVQAIRIVYHQLSPATFQRYEAFVVDPFQTKTGYAARVGSEAPPVGTPLPADAREQVLRVMRGVLADASAQEPVRRAAAYLRDDMELQQARARLCGAGVSGQECSRLLDEWEAGQAEAN